MPESKTTLNNLEINYKVAGQGEPILILHGWGVGSDSWIKVQEFLASKGYKVVVPDLPGFGRSHNPLKSWTVDNYVDWVDDFMDSRDLNSIFLIGHSFGGRIGIKFAVRHPEKVKKLILCAAAGITPRPKIKIGVFAFLSKMGNLIFSLPGLKSLKDFARRIIYFLNQTPDYYFIKNETMKETFQKTIEENLIPFLAKIKTPTLIVWGDQDMVVPVFDAYVMHKEIPDSTLKIIKGGRHGLSLQFPEQLSEIIVQFIRY